MVTALQLFLLIESGQLIVYVDLDRSTIVTLLMRFLKNKTNYSRFINTKL